MKITSSMKVTAMAAALLMCSACGQRTEKTPEAAAEPSVVSEDTSAATVEETFSVSVETEEQITESEASEETAKETSAGTETGTESTEETAQTTAFGEGLPSEFYLDVPVQEELYEEYPDEAIIGQAALSFCGVDCDVAGISSYCTDDNADIMEKFRKMLEGYLSDNGINDIVIENVPHDEMDTDRAMRTVYSGDLIICCDHLDDYFYPKIIIGYDGYDDPNKKPESTYLHYNTPWGYTATGCGAMNAVDVFEEEILSDTEHPIFIISKKQAG